MNWTATLLLAAVALGSATPARALESQDPEPPKVKPAPVEEEAAKEEKPEFTPPPRRKAIAGIGSVTSVSKLTFPSAPDQVYQLDATYVFPERARWRMAPYKEPKTKPGRAQKETQNDRRSRRLQFRCGDGLWTLAPDSMASEAFTDDEKRKTLLQFELRRIALIWPAELEWKAEGQLRRAELPGIGIIEAELDPDSERPLSLRSSDPDGTPREAFSNIQWSAPGKDGRTWPSAWNLEAGGKIAWKEEFTTVRGGLKYNESFFVPFDRRDKPVGSARIKGDVEQIKVPEVAVWRQDLSPEARKDWKLAIAEAREAMGRWVPVFEGSLVELDPRPCFLLGDDGKPTRMELHLTSMPERPPTGWHPQGGFSAVRLVMIGVETLDGSHLKHLRARMPQGHTPGGPWLVVQLTESGVGLTQLIMPALKVR